MKECSSRKRVHFFNNSRGLWSDIYSMMISLLIIFCLQLVGNSLCGEFYNTTDWSWEKSCENHPYAAENGKFVKDLNDANILKQCTLKFDYFDEEPEENDKIQFCQSMYPDFVSNANLVNNKMICVYQRLRVCKDASAHVIGDNCVFLAEKASNLTEAKAICTKKKANLLSPDNEKIITFFTKLYQWPQPTSAVWAVDPANNAYHVFMKYSSIGSIWPGKVASVDDHKAEATVMCIAAAKHLPLAKQSIPFCQMLNEFMHIPSKDINGTCYHTTQSLMQAKQSKANEGLVTVDHFNEACKVRYSELNNVVAPTWSEPRSALTRAVKKWGKKALLIPGVLSTLWRNMDTSQHQTFRPMEMHSSQFSYRIPRQLLKNDTEVYEPESLPVHADLDLWRNGFPINTYKEKRPEHFGMPLGVLLYSIQGNEGRGRMENTFEYRRAPIMCESSLSYAAQYKCREGWEFAYRKQGKKGICIKAFESPEGECSGYTFAHHSCNVIEDGYLTVLAPMASAAEEIAILRSIRTNFKKDMKQMRGVVLGGYQLHNSGKFIWQKLPNDDTDIEIGSQYSRWNHGEPNRARKTCRNNEQNCDTTEKCVSIRYNNGLSMGLNDIFCDKPCKVYNIDGYVCGWSAEVIDL